MGGVGGWVGGGNSPDNSSANISMLSDTMCGYNLTLKIIYRTALEMIQGGSDMIGTDFFFVTIIAHHSSNSQTGLNGF